jgi:uncharacterized protein
MNGWIVLIRDTEAQLKLGEMHSDGQGVPRDYVLAHLWYNLAASGQETKATRIAERRFLLEWAKITASTFRVLEELRMTAGQIAEAQRLAREWEPK